KDTAGSVPERCEGCLLLIEQAAKSYWFACNRECVIFFCWQKATKKRCTFARKWFNEKKRCKKETRQ
ncbi:hypothetical protein KY382_35645, partial [Pseudomonas monteilii]|nr:hypothetical protein [Pseudomonas monteilii]